MLAYYQINNKNIYSYKVNQLIFIKLRNNSPVSFQSLSQYLLDLLLISYIILLCLHLLYIYFFKKELLHVSGVSFESDMRNLFSWLECRSIKYDPLPCELLKVSKWELVVRLSINFSINDQINQSFYLIPWKLYLLFYLSQCLLCQ